MVPHFRLSAWQFNTVYTVCVQQKDQPQLCAGNERSIYLNFNTAIEHTSGYTERMDLLSNYDVR